MKLLFAKQFSNLKNFLSKTSIFISRNKPFAIPDLNTIPVYLFSKSNKDETDKKISDQKDKKEEEKPRQGGDEEPNNNDNDPKFKKLKELYENYGIYILLGGSFLSLYLYRDYFVSSVNEITMNVFII